MHANDDRLRVALALADLLRDERGRTPRDGADVEAQRSLLTQLLDALAKVTPPGKKGGCRACAVEAEIGTEAVPHPVDARLHTCVALDAKARRQMITQHLRAASALLSEEST